MHCLDSGVLAIDEHIERCAGEANDAEREAVLILCDSAMMSGFPGALRLPQQPEALKLFGGARARRADWRSVSCVRAKCGRCPFGARGAAPGAKIYWRDAPPFGKLQPRDAAGQH